eukprot:210359_1
MSTQQKQSELLTFGYVNEEYNGILPTQLIKLMQLFYDEYCYWILKDAKLKKFLKKKTGKYTFCPKSFTIKGIVFKIGAFPNGVGNISSGLVKMGLKVEYLPENIQYIEYYYEINCESLNYKSKTLCKATHMNRHGHVKGICRSSQIQTLETVCFNCKTDIKYIKYKKDCNKNDYCAPINKIRKHYEFTWNINELLMEKCHKMIFNEKMESNSFENGNWYLKLRPNGGSIVGALGESRLSLYYLSFPYSIKSMDITSVVVIDYGKIKIERIFNKKMTIEKSFVWSYNIMSFEELKKMKSFSIVLRLKITNIYDKYDQLIHENDWTKHGIIET